MCVFFVGEQQQSYGEGDIKFYDVAASNVSASKRIGLFFGAEKWTDLKEIRKTVTALR